MRGLLGVICLHIGEIPNQPLPIFKQYVRPEVGWVLSPGVARRQTLSRALKCSLSGIPGGDADRIEIEHRLAVLAEPQNCFISTRKPRTRMKTMPKVPDDPVLEMKASVLKE
jgi:hypothetical protein